jgi:hypothetical protein
MLPYEMIRWDRNGERVVYFVVSGTEHGSITCDTDTGNRDSFFGDELMSTTRLSKVPDADIATAVTADQFSLVRVNDHVVNRRAVDVVALDAATAGIPYFDGDVFRACNHPFPFTVESYACNIAGMTFECENGVRVAGFDVVELDIVVAGRRKVALVGSDAEAIDLRVGMLDCARADS